VDPALRELIGEGSPEDEVAVVARLRDGTEAPPGLRVIARFGSVLTARAPRGLLGDLHGLLASLKAPKEYAGEFELSDRALELEIDESTPEMLETDIRRPEGLRETGRGCVIGVVDWGVCYPHLDFRNADGTTRFDAIWDQRASGRSPAPYGYGVVHDRAAIDRALRQADPFAALGYLPADNSHGSHVLGIAAGNGRGGGPKGVAPEASLLFVHLGSRSDDLGSSVELLEAIDFLVRIAGARPLAINLSLGRHAGPHDGTLLMERAIDWLLTARPGTAVVQSTGNYYSRDVHMSGRIREAVSATLPFRLGERDDVPVSLEVWYKGADEFTARASGPNGAEATASLGASDVMRTADGHEVGRLYHRRSDPNNGDNLINLFLDPAAPSGEWLLEIEGVDVVDGRWHAWLERNASCRACQAQFHPDVADPKFSTGSICNAMRTIAVGAFSNHDPHHSIPDFSSTGPTRDGRTKPLLAAPGVRVLSVRSSTDPNRISDYVRMSGTSMAAPHVTGTVALMFEAAGSQRVSLLRRTLFQSLTSSAESDPDHRCGYGMLDVARAVEGARALALTAPRAPGAPNTPRTSSRRREAEDLLPVSSTLALPASQPLQIHSALESSEAAELQWAPARSESPSLPNRLPAAAAEGEISHQFLRLGSKGLAVAFVQSALNFIDEVLRQMQMPGLEGCPLSVDRDFRQRTRQAVVGFQQRTFVGKPDEWDGIVGPKTFGSIEQIVRALGPPELLAQLPPAIVPIIRHNETVPVIVLPGVMGTRLSFPSTTNLPRWDPDDQAEMARWFFADGDDKLRGLSVTSPASIIADGLNPDEHRRGWDQIAQSFYRPLLLDIDESFAVQPLLTSLHVPQLHCPVWVMGYDWRRSNGRHFQALDHFIDRVLESERGAQQVIIVTHSMGGLVLRAALRLGEGPFANKIRGVIHTVQPAVGAVAAARRFRTGFDSGIDGSLGEAMAAMVQEAYGIGEGEDGTFDEGATVKKFVQTWLFQALFSNRKLGPSPIFYNRLMAGVEGPNQLLPSDRAPRSWWPPSQSQPNVSVHDLYGRPGGLIEPSLQLDPAGLALMARFAEAKDFHSAIGGLYHPVTGVIFSTGLTTDTTLDPQARPKQGDGTVPEFSARCPDLASAHFRVGFQRVEHAACFKNKPFRDAVLNGIQHIASGAPAVGEHAPPQRLGGIRIQGAIP
jgi:subtilisin family serine protease